MGKNIVSKHFFRFSKFEDFLPEDFDEDSSFLSMVFCVSKVRIGQSNQKFQLDVNVHFPIVLFFLLKKVSPLDVLRW